MQPPSPPPAASPASQVAIKQLKPHLTAREQATLEKELSIMQVRGRGVVDTKPYPTGERLRVLNSNKRNNSAIHARAVTHQYASTLRVSV